MPESGSRVQKTSIDLPTYAGWRPLLLSNFAQRRFAQFAFLNARLGSIPAICAADYTMRLHALAATIENGFVHLPGEARGLAEFTAFQAGRHDDQVDSTA
jgi:hypothetical protein